MSFEDKQEGYSSAMLGNALRAAAPPTEQDFVEKTRTILAAVREDLYVLVSSDDEAVLSMSSR